MLNELKPGEVRRLGYALLRIRPHSYLPRHAAATARFALLINATLEGVDLEEIMAELVMLVEWTLRKAGRLASVDDVRLNVRDDPSAN